jgi:hypothetical protein
MGGWKKVVLGRKNCIVLDWRFLFFARIYRKMFTFQYISHMSVFKLFYITIVLFSTHIFSSFHKEWTD